MGPDRATFLKKNGCGVLCLERKSVFAKGDLGIFMAFAVQAQDRTAEQLLLCRCSGSL